MSLRTLKTAILTKIEATYGVDSVPTGAANGMLMYDAKLSPNLGQQVERRPTVPYFRSPQKLPTKQYRKLTGYTELVGHPTKGTAPLWSPLAVSSGLAQAAVAATSVTYTPTTDNIGSATHYFSLDGVRHRMLGARGNGVLVVNPHDLPKIEWDFMGLYEPPTDVATPAVTLTNWQEPQVVNNENTPTFTVNGVALELAEFRLDFGRKTVLRNRPNAKYVMITDGQPMVKFKVAYENMATFNPFTLNDNQTAFAINLVQGVGANRIVTINLPNCRLSLPEDLSEEDGLADIMLEAVPLPTSGNDEFSIVLT